MHKKLETDLMSLAHSILQMKNKEDVFALKDKAGKLYEKLSVLAFVEEYVNSTPNLKDDKVAIEEKIAEAIQKKEEILETKPEEPVTIVYDLEEEVADNEEITIENELLVDESEAVIEDEIVIEEQTIETLFFEEPQSTQSYKNDVKNVAERKTLTLLDELKDTVSVDITADMFEAKATSVNDKLAKGIQIGLNDRIAFVKNLFNNSQEDYNRVISQLNSFKTEEEAIKFIKRTVKPDYDWSAHEALENRFLGFVQNRFN